MKTLCDYTLATLITVVYITCLTVAFLAEQALEAWQ